MNVGRKVQHQTSRLTPNAPLVSIVVVNYNGMRYLKGCLDSIQRLTYPRREVILIDNASSDGSVCFVKENYPCVRIIENKENLGFAAGNNVGINAARGEYVFLLNQDTEVDRFCLDNLLNAIKIDDSVGVCGAKIRLFDERNRLQHAGGRYHLIGVALDRGFYEIDSGQYDKLEDVTFVCGAALLFRKSAASNVGLLDPIFFMYHEDVDFCIRMWLCGFRVLYVPSAVVYHKSGYVDTLKTGRRHPLIEFHKNKNTLLILLKNFDLFTILKWLPVTLCYRLYWLLRYLADRNLSCAKSVIDALIWTIRNVPYINSARQKIASAKKSSSFNVKECCADISEVWREFRKLSELRLSLKPRQP